MTIEEILSQWENDSKISPMDLGNESLKIPKLHHKYYQIFVQERIKCRALESQYKTLKLDKHEFYKSGDGWFRSKQILLV